jgi:hypothetical protein
VFLWAGIDEAQEATGFLRGSDFASVAFLLAAVGLVWWALGKVGALKTRT